MKKYYRIVSLGWGLVVKDGFKSIRAAAAWVEDNACFGGIWSSGWDIVEYYA